MSTWNKVTTNEVSEYEFRKLETFYLWNPELSPLTNDPEFTAWNPESKTVLNSLALGEILYDPGLSVKIMKTC